MSGRSATTRAECPCFDGRWSVRLDAEVCSACPNLKARDYGRRYQRCIRWNIDLYIHGNVIYVHHNEHYFTVDLEEL